MTSTTHRETDRELDEVTLLELGAGEWDERQLHRGPVRHLVEDDEGPDEAELETEARGSWCGGSPSDEDRAEHSSGPGHCH